MTATIPIKRSRSRKPTAARTCCESHADTCQFGRDHKWSVGWLGGSASGLGIGEEGWHDSTVCVTCLGICIADMDEAGRA